MAKCMMINRSVPSTQRQPNHGTIQRSSPFTLYASPLHSLYTTRVPTPVKQVIVTSCLGTKEGEPLNKGDNQSGVKVTRSGLVRLSLPLTAVALLPTHFLSAPLPAQAVVDGRVAAQVFQTANRAVVCIGDFAVNSDGSQVSEGVGSGIVWDKAGHIVTNYHVVSKLAADKNGRQKVSVEVLQEDGVSKQTFNAQIAGLDSAHDIAVLKIEAPQEFLSPITVGTSRDLRVGQSCFAIGNPFGLGGTLTAGLVSGLGRTIPSPAGRPITGVIQTDAAINSGSSGGALLDSNGRLVGINTATFTRSGSGLSSGVNFALPVDLVYDLVPQMVKSYNKA